MTKKQSKSTKQANAQRAAERAASIRQEQEAKERRRRTLMVSASVLAVLAVVVAIAVFVQSGRDTTGQTATPPEGAVAEYALAMGPADAPVEVTVYEDFMCPYCGLFESVSRDTLKDYAASGDVQVRYHVVSFLDGQSSSEYSTRAANALAVVLDQAGPEVAVKFHDLLFANQPEEGGDGLSDEQLVDYAVEAGADEAAVAAPIESRTFEQWVVNSTGEWSDRGHNGTPTVTVDGETIEFESAEDLLANTRSAIESALDE